MPRFASRVGSSARALALFVGLSLFFFWPLWAPNAADRMTIGSSGDDFIRQFYPYRAFVARAWASGQPPLWNPHQYAGTPTWADPQQAVVYPWRVLQAPLAIGGRLLPMWSVELEAVLHVALAGWFTYLLLRRLRAGPFGAVFGGVVYAFGGYLTGYPVVQLAVLDTAVWLPATMWGLAAAFGATREGDVRRAARWTVVAAGASALMVLAGHPQTAVYGFAAGLAFWVWSIARARSHRTLGASCGVAWLALSLGLSAAQWYPSWALTHRLAERFEPGDLLAGLALVDIAQLVVPGVMTQWSPLFVGAIPLVVVLWGVWRCRETWFWVGLAVFSWLVSLGGHSPVLPALLRIVPALAMFRHHERAAVVFSLAMAVAAGLSAASLLAAPRRQQRQAASLILGVSVSVGLLAMVGTARTGLIERVLRVVDEAPWRGNPADALAFTSLVLVIAGVVMMLRGRDRWSIEATGVALVALVLFELFSVNQGRALAPAEPFVADPLLATLEPRRRDGRLSSEALLAGGPNDASLHGLYDTTGDSPIRLRAYDELAESTTEIERWGMLGVRYVVSDRAFPADAPVAELSRDGDRVLYETHVAAPLTWVQGGSSLEKTFVNFGQKPLSWLLPGVDPGGRERLGDADGVSAAGEAELVGLDAGRIVVEARLSEPSAVVVSTIYDPGWRVSVRGLDGGDQPSTPDSPVLRTHASLMATHVLAPGRWRVEWTYRPTEVIVGLSLSLISLLAGVVLWRPSRVRPS